MAKTYILDYRNIQTRGFWSDPFVMKLPLKEKLFYIYILTNPRITYCGIFEFSIEESALYLKMPEKEVTALVEKFATEYKKIAWSKDTEEIAIVNWMKHNTFSERQEMGFQNALKAVKNKDLNAYVMGLDTHTNGIPNPSTYILFNTSHSLSLNSSQDNGNTKDKRTTLDAIQTLLIEYAKSDHKLMRALAAYYEMRRNMKDRNSFTEYAAELMLKELDKLGKTNAEKIALLNQSIVNSWKGIFPIKGNNGKPQPPDVEIPWLESYWNEKNNSEDEEKKKRDAEWEAYKKTDEYRERYGNS